MSHQFEVQEPDIHRQYLDRVAGDFPSKDVEVVFLKRLRNLLTHNQLPKSLMNISLGPPQFSMTILMPIDPLLSWQWDSRAIAQWITNQSDGLDIATICARYAEKAFAFDSWLWEVIRDYYRDNLIAYQRRPTPTWSDTNRFRPWLGGPGAQTT